MCVFSLLQEEIEDLQRVWRRVERMMKFMGQQGMVKYTVLAWF